MRKEGRYKTSHLMESQYEQGSRGRVLKNLLGIKSKREMDYLEAREQLRALQELTGIYSSDHRFTAEDICKIHKIWLGSVYSWAGQYRSVNVSKGGFSFAMALQVPHLMKVYQEEILYKYTPCRFDSHEKIAEALAVVHAELVLIHPFREGNGRMARLLSMLMALQAGLPVLYFGGIKGRIKTAYITAVQAGLDGDYRPMTRIFSDVIRQSIKRIS